jgi:hypothetical protein
MPTPVSLGRLLAGDPVPTSLLPPSRTTRALQDAAARAIFTDLAVES